MAICQVRDETKDRAQSNVELWIKNKKTKVLANNK